MVGIYDCFGYGAGYDVPFPQRYQLIKRAGFDCVMLWWSDQFGRGEGYQQDAQFAREAGLQIENIHAPVHQQNYLFLHTLDGEEVFSAYQKCIRDCATYQVATMVVHLPNDDHPVNNLGIQRMKRLVDEAEEKNVNIALENLRNIQNLAWALNLFPSQKVGICYDSCHHINYASQANLLKQYGKRLMALHLHDNGGEHHQHQLPWDGHIDWPSIMGNIALTGYRGATALEPMNWDYAHLSIQQFLNLAYQRARKLDELRRIA